MYYEIHGSGGTPLLLLHGGLFDIDQQFGELIPGLAADRQVIAADFIAVAIGQSRATEIARAFPDVQTDAKGRVVVDQQTHRTGNPKVWSGGDCVNGGKEGVNAADEAKIAVRDIQRALMGA